MKKELTTQELVVKILKDKRPEVLACMIDRSLGTIALWKAGKRQASKGDYELLRRIVK